MRPMRADVEKISVPQADISTAGVIMEVRLRPLTAEIDLASSLSHVESRVIDNDYTISFAGRRYRIARQDVRAGMKRQSKLRP